MIVSIHFVYDLLMFFRQAHLTTNAYARESVNLAPLFMFVQ